MLLLPLFLSSRPSTTPLLTTARQCILLRLGTSPPPSRSNLHCLLSPAPTQLWSHSEKMLSPLPNILYLPLCFAMRLSVCRYLLPSPEHPKPSMLPILASTPQARALLLSCLLFAPLQRTHPRRYQGFPTARQASNLGSECCLTLSSPRTLPNWLPLPRLCPRPGSIKNQILLLPSSSILVSCKLHRLSLGIAPTYRLMLHSLAYLLPLFLLYPTFYLAAVQLLFPNAPQCYLALASFFQKMDNYTIGEAIGTTTARTPETVLPTATRGSPLQTNGQEAHESVIDIQRSSSSTRLVPTQTDPPKPQEESFVQFGLWVSGVAFATLCGLLASKFGEEKGIYYVLFMLCVLMLLTVLILGIAILVLAYVPFTNWLDTAFKFKILEILRNIDLGLICLFTVVGFSSLLFIKRHIK